MLELSVSLLMMSGMYISENIPFRCVFDRFITLKKENGRKGKVYKCIIEKNIEKVVWSYRYITKNTVEREGLYVDYGQKNTLKNCWGTKWKLNRWRKRREKIVKSGLIIHLERLKNKNSGPRFRPGKKWWTCRGGEWYIY